MLKRKAIRKILVTTLTIVILLLIYAMPSNSTSIETLDITPKIQYTSPKIGYIYLLNDNDLLVKVNVLVEEEKSKEKQITEILNKLLNNNTNPKGLKNIIPPNTKILDIKVDGEYLKVNFSKQLLQVDENLEGKVIESICYSLFEMSEIKQISILIENENISKYFKNIPEKITRDFGINKKYTINSFKDIKKVVVYYITEIEENKYMVPVTSYVNDNEEKIKIIIENLAGNYIYEPNLMSFLNSNTELINYEITDDIMLLNFDNNIFSPGGTILEEVVYTISNSVFDTYDVNKVVINVENKTIEEIKKT